MEELLDANNLDVNLLEELNLESPGDEFGHFYSDSVRNVRQDFICLENGAEAMFLRPGDLDPSKKHPMLLIIHGGPFSSSPYQMFLPGRHMLLL